MTLLQTYLTGVALSLLISLMIVSYLNKSLINLLVDLFGTENRAKFWAHITNLSFVLMSLLMSIINRPKPGIDNFYQISRQAGWTLFGMVITLIFVSMSISNFVYQFNKQNLQALAISEREKIQ